MDPAVLALQVLDKLETAIFVLAADLHTELLRNAAGRRLFRDLPLPKVVREAAEGFAASRRDQNRPPPPLRLAIGERAFYLRVLANDADPPTEIVLLTEEVLRDVDAFKLLSARYDLSRREYQVVTALRLGKTNRQIASDLGLAEGTVNVHVHNLLRRFDVPNRTRLVDVVERILSRKT